MIPGEEGGATATIEGAGVTVNDPPVMGGILSASLGEVKEANAKAAEAQPLDAPTAPGERPAWCPEQFWDAQKQTFRAEGMVKSYNEIRAEANRLRNEMGTKGSDAAPETPAGYLGDAAFKDGNLVLPESAAAWGDIPKDDPMLEAFTKACHENGIGQKQFNALLPKVLESFAPLLPGPVDVEGELAKLDGDKPGSGKELALNVARRISALQSHGELSDEEVGFWQEIGSTAKGVRALAKMLNARDDGHSIPVGGAMVGTKMSLAEWQSEVRNNQDKMDKDEGYRNRMLAAYPGA